MLTIFFTQYQRYALNSDSTAVIIEKEFQAKSSPDESATELFPVFEGYKVEIEDKYVVGYGLDDKQFKRNLRDIYVISE